MNPTSILSQKTSSWLILLLFGVCCVGWIPSCLSPCDQLAQTICTEMKTHGTSELCPIAQQEFRQASENFRRCQLLTTQWTNLGRQHLKQMLTKYKRNRTTILNMKLKVGEVRREQEYQRFRQTLRTLLQKPWEKISPPPRITHKLSPTKKIQSRKKPPDDEDDE